MLAGKPDGYTVGLTHNWDTQVSYLDPEAKAPYHRADFVPVGLIQQTGPVTLVRADSPHRTMRDLVAAARARPGQITYATSGPRAESTRTMRLLEQQHGARFNLVPFKDVPSSVTALLGGHLDVAGSNVAVALPHVKAGTARVLSVHEVTGQPGRRNPFFPDVPTSREEGFDIDLISSTGLSLPRGTPKPVVDAWARTLERALGTPSVRSTMQAAGVAIAYLGPEAYAAHWQDADAKVRRFLTESGVRVREG
jgi:tripartite-type tricarboxylate transporter receptor subunit TctC